MNFKQLFDPSYLFDSQPQTEMKFLWPLMVCFLALIAIGLVLQLLMYLKKFHPVTRGFVKRIPGKLYGMSALGFFLLLFRYEGSPYLSARILLILLGVSYLVWAIWFAIKAKKEYPRRMETYLNKL